MTNIVATYHRDCPDGTTAAACLLKKHPEAKVFPLSHSYTPEELAEVLAEVDADTEAYTIDCILGATELAAKAKTLTIIDHHVSIEDEIKKFAHETENVTLVFDLKHSGSGLAWPHFFPDMPTPEVVLYVEDIDIWNWNYGDRARHAVTFVGTHVNQPEKVVPLFDADIEMIVARGKDMTTYEEGLINKYLAKAEPTMVTFGRDTLPMYNTPFFDTFIGNLMSEKHGCVSGVYDIRGQEVRLSFRSKEGNNPTALDIASRLGGGGHKHAAGARMTREEFLNALT